MNIRVWRRLKLRLELVREPRQTGLLWASDGNGGHRLIPMYDADGALNGALRGDNRFVKTGDPDKPIEVHNPSSGPIKGGFTS